MVESEIWDNICNSTINHQAYPRLWCFFMFFSAFRLLGMVYLKISKKLISLFRDAAFHDPGSVVSWEELNLVLL